MDKRRIMPETLALPSIIHNYIGQAACYDYTFNNGQVFFIDRDDGYFLKIAPRGTLADSVALAHFFHRVGLTARVLHYESNDRDYMLQARVPGENAIAERYLAHPKLVCDTIAESLRRLHNVPLDGCPIVGVTSARIAPALRNYTAQKLDPWMLDFTDLPDLETAYRYLVTHSELLVEDTVLHGDACLPNVMLQNYAFSGFIDFDGGGVGDRHYDLVWALWSLQFNLKTRAYEQRFIDAYGRDVFDLDRYRLCCVLEAFTYTD